jgi:hypothetical protein
MSETVDLKDGAFINHDLLPEVADDLRMVAGSCTMCCSLWAVMRGLPLRVGGSEST